MAESERQELNTLIDAELVQLKAQREELEDLWHEFSDSCCACWLNPCTGDEGNLDDFAYWLSHYGEKKYCEEE